MSDFLLRSMNEKYFYPIRVTRDKKQWDSRRCWSAHCSNDIHIVHITQSNNATHGYCFWCFRTSMLFACLYDDSKNGKWVECIKDYNTKKPILKERNDRETFDKLLKIKYANIKKGNKK